MGKDRDEAMRKLRDAYHDVKQNRLNAKSEHVQQILDLGLWEAKDRVNTHETYLELTGGKEANYLV